MVAENVAFAVVALLMVVAGVRVVTTQNIVRAALYLVVVLTGAAAIYILLAAEFVAVFQLLIYVGTIIVLFLIGIMLTRAPIGREFALDNDQRWAALVVSLFLAGLLAAVVVDAFQGQKIHFGSVQRTADLGYSIFGTYLVPFEVVSVLLLAAVVGAIAIARKD